MGREDVYENDYLDNAELFADLINGVLYQGEQVVRPQELSEQDGELRSIQGYDVRKILRDKVRMWRGTALAILVVENQTKVDYRMVIRAMLSESMAYDKQWKTLKDNLKAEDKNERNKPEEKAENLKKGFLTPDEYLSGMRKKDKFIPVITVVVYFGKEKPWDGARTLHELLDVEGNEEKILPFISNYQLNIFDYHEYEDFGRFHSELQSVFEFLRYSGEKKQMKAMLEEHKERYEKLSALAKILLTKLANIKKPMDVSDEEFVRGEFSMCKAFEDMREEGKAEGKVEERENGICSVLHVVKKFHGSKEQAITTLMEEYTLSEEAAIKKLELYW